MERVFYIFLPIALDLRNTDLIKDKDESREGNGWPFKGPVVNVNGTHEYYFSLGPGVKGQSLADIDEFIEWNKISPAW